MTARPWMPLYIADYLADTAHLTTAEHGAYLLLIMHYWRNEGLPADEEQLRRITRMSARAWASSRDHLRSLFGDNWRHTRIDHELQQAIEKSRTNSANAKRRHSERKPVADVSQTHSQSHIQERKKEPSLRSAPLELDLDVVGEPAEAKLFRLGKTILVSFGIAEKRTGPLIGQWLKQRPDPAGLLAAIQFTRDQNVADPVAYVSAIVHSKGKTNGNARETLDDRAGRLADEARRLEREAGLERPDAAVGSH